MGISTALVHKANGQVFHQLHISKRPEVGIRELGTSGSLRPTYHDILCQDVYTYSRPKI